MMVWALAARLFVFVLNFHTPPHHGARVRTDLLVCLGLDMLSEKKED